MKKHLLKFLLALFLFAGWQSSFGQVTIYSQSFETDLDGYSHTPSQTPATDPGDQYFHRAEPTDAAIYEAGGQEYTNVTGSWLFVGSNPNAINSTNPGVLTFDPITVTGYTNLEFHADFGACPNDWDNTDTLRVMYNFDGGSWQTLYYFDNLGDGTNDTLIVAGNSVGGINTANGTKLTFALTTISSDNFIGSGDVLNIQIYCDADANYEAFGVDNILVKGTLATSNDTDSEVAASATLTEPVAIATTVDTEGEKVQVFDFTLTDKGTADGLATIIDQIKITQGDNNDITDWTTAIAGAVLNGADVTDLAGTINSNNITFASDDMISIADGGSEEYTLSIWLTTTGGLTEGDNLEFALAYTNITADAAGSVFGAGAPESGDANLALDITATQLAFTTQPTDLYVNQTMSTVAVSAIDENGNVDAGYASTSITVAFTGSGNMTGTTSISTTSGVAEFTDLAFDAIESSVTLTASGAFSGATSNTFDVTAFNNTTLPYKQNFATDLGNTFTYNVSGATKQWTHTADYAYASGFNSGDIEEDWLIFPVINLDNYSNEVMVFDAKWKYGNEDADNYFKLVYSTDYIGGNNPSTSGTWNDLTFTVGASDTWTSSGEVDLSSINGTTVYIAFKYRYTSGNYRNWSVKNVIITEPAITITAPTDNQTFDTEENVTVDFVTYNQTSNLKLQVWIDDQSTWVDQETGIDPATGTVSTIVPEEAQEASTYKLRLIDETDNNPISNEVPFAINDVSGPVLSLLNPADEGTKVARNSNLTASFAEVIKAGTGSIYIKQVSDDAVIATYDIAAPEIDLTGGSGTVLTINPASDLPNEVALYVEMAAGVILDSQDNGDFAVTKGDWNFTTADEIAPTATLSPISGATSIAKNTDLTITLDEPIYTMAGGATVFDNTTVKGILTLKLTDASGTDVAFDASINGTYDVITINPTADLAGSTVYYYAISDQYKDASDNQGAAASATFTTIDDSAPVVTITPANGATNVARTTSIAIEFDKAVRKLDNSAVVDGDLAAMITLKETNASGADVAFTATINTGKDAISIVPTATLKEGQAYFVEIAAQLESDLDAAIAVTNATFTTIDDVVPTATFSPVNSATGVAINSIITITFDEAIVNADASAITDANALITLKETDASGTNIAFNATIDANKKVITITPSANFSYNQVVYVAMAIVEDAAGNETTLQSITFTTLVNTDATLTSSVYNINTDYSAITNVSAGTTLAAFEANLTPAEGATIKTYEADGTTAATDLATGYKVIVTAQDGTTKKTYSVVISPSSDEIFFSEYIEGSSNNKAIELYNGTGADVDLSAYLLKKGTNGADFSNLFIPEGILNNKDVYVIANSGAVDEIKNQADTIDATGKIVYFNGDDAIGLFKISGTDTTLIDVIGLTNGTDPGTAWPVAGIDNATAEHTLIRKSSIGEGNTDWDASAGTSTANSEWKVLAQNYFDNIGKHSFGFNNEANIITFAFAEQLEEAVIENDSVKITVLNGTNVTALEPVITVSDGAMVDPESGDAVNFTSPVIYTVTAEDYETTKEWTIKVTVSPTQNTEANIKVLEVAGADSININMVDTTATIYAPYGFDASAIQPEFTISAGATITDTTKAYNFATPVTYTITAQDGSIKTWEVSFVIPEATEVTIYDIQHTTDASGDSPYDGKLVKTSGIVTGIDGGNIWIQDGTGAWNGIMIYSSATASAVSVGDEIEFVAEVDEYYNLTELKNVEELNKISTGNTLPAVTEITTLQAQNEDYESVLIKITKATCNNTDAGNGMFVVNDGSGDLLVDDDFFAFTPTLNYVYNITGIGHYSFSERKILPRDVNDIFDVTTGVEDVVFKSMKLYPNPSNGLVNLELNNVNNENLQVEVYNVIGKLIYKAQITENVTEINLTEMSSGIYYVSVNNGNAKKVSKLMIK